jgi:hypothetical protein
MPDGDTALIADHCPLNVLTEEDAPGGTKRSFTWPNRIPLANFRPTTAILEIDREALAQKLRAMEAATERRCYERLSLNQATGKWESAPGPHNVPDRALVLGSNRRLEIAPDVGEIAGEGASNRFRLFALQRLEYFPVVISGQPLRNMFPYVLPSFMLNAVEQRRRFRLNLGNTSACWYNRRSWARHTCANAHELGKSFPSMSKQ